MGWRPVVAEEQDVLGRWIAEARGLAWRCFVVKIDTFRAQLVQDLYAEAWLDLQRGAYEPSWVIEVIGAALGQMFVDQHGYRWGVIEDDHGTAFAVQHPKTGTTMFPLAAIAKRIDKRDDHFVEAFVQAFGAT